MTVIQISALRRILVTCVCRLSVSVYYWVLTTGLKNDWACALICGRERRLKRAPIQNDCLFAGN